MVEPFVNKILICGLGRSAPSPRASWPFPSLQISVLRSGLGPPCEEVKLANHIFENLSDAQIWHPQTLLLQPLLQITKKHFLARNGVPLLIEKPLRSNLGPRNELIELKNLAGSIPVVLAYVLRHDPCAVYVKEHLSGGILGTIIDASFYCGSWLPDWRPGLNYRNCVSARSDLGGGVLLEISHEIDLALWFFGEINLHLSLLRQSNLLDIDVEDQAILVGSTPNKTSISFNLNFCTMLSMRMLCVRGDQGEIVWDMINGEVQLSHEDPGRSQRFTSATTAEERYTNQVLHFLSCVNRTELPISSVDDGIKVLDFIERARQQSFSS